MGPSSFFLRVMSTIGMALFLGGCATTSSQQNSGLLSLVNPENTCRNYHSFFKSKYEKYVCKAEYDDGDVYVGEHMDGKRHGRGVYKWSDGATFEGVWIRGEREEGTQINPDGSKYEGAFRYGKLHGNGKITDSSGNVLREGLFEFGRFVPQWEIEKRRLAAADAERERQDRERAEKFRRDEDLRQKQLLEQQERERVAREGDGSAHDLLCKKYGLKPLTSQYADCRIQLDTHASQQAEQRRLYEQSLAEYQRERERRKGEAMFLLGMGMLANSSRPATQPITPIPQPPAMQNFNIFIKGQSPINCMSNLGVIDCR